MISSAFFESQSPHLSDGLGNTSLTGMSRRADDADLRKGRAHTGCE